MKAVILAGGRGTRLAEETVLRPKPIVEIGGRPIIWHIMKIYAAHGIVDFVVCLGYKGYLSRSTSRTSACTTPTSRSTSAPAMSTYHQPGSSLAGHRRRHGRRDDDGRPPQAGREYLRRTSCSA